jgi:hypothetical protein
VECGVAERTRQLPLTGPLEEVAPWEMDHLPGEDEIENKITISTGNRALARVAVDSSPPMSPTIEMWKAQKSAGVYARDDGRSMSSSALPLSTAGFKRTRADSVAASSDMINGERTLASSASLPLDTVTKAHEDERGVVVTSRIPHSRDGSVAASKLSRGRSLTGQTTTPSIKSSVRPASSSASSGLGHGGATSIISTMNKAQMEQVLPWELHPIPIAIQRSSTSTTTVASGMTTGEEKDRKTVRFFFFFSIPLFLEQSKLVFFCTHPFRGLCQVFIVARPPCFVPS